MSPLAEWRLLLASIESISLLGGRMCVAPGIQRSANNATLRDSIVLMGKKDKRTRAGKVRWFFYRFAARQMLGVSLPDAWGEISSTLLWAPSMLEAM